MLAEFVCKLSQSALAWNYSLYIVGINRKQSISLICAAAAALACNPSGGHKVMGRWFIRCGRIRGWLESGLPIPSLELINGL
ncbi:hypothetical protein V6N13_012963 [Hibiscus sabdariffa]|uniref:Uncharacterized protein n=1 Tax=Hibiscus sabdariffa TaxID=183260 RepID=A0ABR2SHL1_9ROSI